MYNIGDVDHRPQGRESGVKRYSPEGVSQKHHWREGIGLITAFIISKDSTRLMPTTNVKTQQTKIIRYAGGWVVQKEKIKKEVRGTEVCA